MKKDQIRVVRASGRGCDVDRRSGAKLSQGVLYPVRDGEPLAEGAELVRISESDDGNGWHEIETLYSNTRATSDGPAQVATPAYREGYDRVFGKKPTVGLA